MTEKGTAGALLEALQSLTPDQLRLPVGRCDAEFGWVRLDYAEVVWPGIENVYDYPDGARSVVVLRERPLTPEEQAEAARLHHEQAAAANARYWREADAVPVDF